MSQINGREVLRVAWGDGEGAFSMSEGGGLTMHVVNMYHGDHDDDWIVVMKDGVEVERHNVRYIGSITWKPPAQPSSKSGKV